MRIKFVHLQLVVLPVESGIVNPLQNVKPIIRNRAISAPNRPHCGIPHIAPKTNPGYRCKV